MCKCLEKKTLLLINYDLVADEIKKTFQELFCICTSCLPDWWPIREHIKVTRSYFRIYFNIHQTTQRQHTSTSVSKVSLFLFQRKERNFSDKLTQNLTTYLWQITQSSDWLIAISKSLWLTFHNRLSYFNLLHTRWGHNYQK